MESSEVILMASQDFELQMKLMGGETDFVKIAIINKCKNKQKKKLTVLNVVGSEWMLGPLAFSASLNRTWHVHIC